jgi:site-specific DNA-cytosine methylase
MLGERPRSSLHRRAEVQAVAYRTFGDGAVFEEGDRTAPLTTGTDRRSHVLTVPETPVAFRAAGQDGFVPSEITPPIAASDGGGSGVPTVAIQNALRGKSQNGLGISDDDTMYTLDQGSQHAVAFCGMAQAGAGWAPPSCPTSVDVALPLDTKRAQAIATTMAVRRLTPIECERLQGFPDGYTKIDEKTADGPRYKALGNSMAIPCMAWIGKRIQMVEDITHATETHSRSMTSPTRI